MKNPFRSHILPRFPIISGIIGFLLRIWLFSSADAKGLLPSNHFANASLYVLSAIVLLVLFLSTRKLTPRRISKHSIRVSSTYSYMLGGLGLALNAAYLLAHSTAKLTGLAVAASLVGTLIMVYMAFLCFAYKRIPYVFFVSVSIIIILQIIAQCQTWGAEPQLQKYFFPMMASIFLLLSAYYRTLLAARRPVAQRLAFFSQAAVYFCILSLNTPQWMFYCGMLFWAASQIYPCTYYKRKV